MTKLIVHSDNPWTKKKIKSALEREKELLKRAIQRTETKLQAFESKYGKLEQESLHGKIDDMEIIEWEGEVETRLKLKKQFQSIEEITVEYK